VEPADPSPEGAAYDSPGRKSGVRPKSRNQVPEGRHNRACVRPTDSRVSTVESPQHQAAPHSMRTFALRLKAYPQPRPRGPGETFQRARRWQNLPTVEARNYGLRSPHRFGHLLLRHIRIAPGLDQGRGHAKFLCQRFIRSHVSWVFLPPLERLFHRNKLTLHDTSQNPLAIGCIAAHLCKRSKGGASSVTIAPAKLGQPPKLPGISGALRSQPSRVCLAAASHFGFSPNKV